MNAMFATRLPPAAVLAALLVAAFPPPATTAADPPDDEATRVRALLVCDTADAQIGDSVRADLDTMSSLLKDAFAEHKDRLELTTLTGKDVTRDAVLNYYRDLKPDPSETLLFYFSGHGATERQHGHYFQVYPSAQEDQTKPVLLRDEVRVAMQAKGPRLIVLLSDACSTLTDFSPEERPVTFSPQWETVRSLLLRPRGVVDINSVSEGEVAVGLGQGGFFTRSLADLLRKPFTELDANKDGFLHWQELLPPLQESAQAKFGDYRAEWRKQVDERLKKAVTVNEKLAAEQEKKLIDGQESQTVRVYSLPPLARFGVSVLDAGGKGVKVVLVHDYTPAALAGFKPGDVILKIGDRPVNSPDDFAAAVGRSKGTVKVEFRRLKRGDRSPSAVDVRLAPWPAPGKEG
jgi:hypothetical protein